MSEETEQSTIAGLIDAQGDALGDAPYILFDEEVVSFAGFAQRTRQVARGLLAQGGAPGDGVALLMGNCPEYLEIIRGMPRAGLYTVPINVAPPWARRPLATCRVD